MSAADNYYNLLAQGFRAGQLSLKKQVPLALGQVADPYDPSAYASFGLEVGDMSYYKRKLYLYFGVTPAVLLFWPYVALTGHYLLQRDAVVNFCIVGFLTSLGLLCALWRRYFAEVSVAVVAVGGLALGLATGTPLMLTRCEVYQVPISCGYAFTMLALAAMWKPLHETERRCWWLAAASLAYGLAVAARPSLLFGSVILLVPVVQAWRERRTMLAPLLAATVPIALIGLGLMLYNLVRFDSPFEFGAHYQLNGQRQLTRELFHLRYLWVNFKLYYLEPARWSGRFPFVHDITLPPVPAGGIGVDKPFGVLTNIPLVWLAAAVPLAWRRRPIEAFSALCGFLGAAAMLFGICTATLCLYFGTGGRYEVEFLPALVLLAVTGVLSLERSLAGRPVWRYAFRWSWSLLLGFSVAFNLLVSIRRCAQWQDDMAFTLERQGKVKEAIRHYEQALRLNPDYAEAHNNLGVALAGQGKLLEAIGHYEQALRIKPYHAEAHHSWGIALEQVGRVEEAIQHYEQALRLKPDYAEAQNNLGVALVKQDRLQEAIGHYEEAVRIDPDYALAHYNLGIALARLGRLREAIGHWEQALRLKPDFAEPHYSLGVAFGQTGRAQEGIEQYEQALRIKPDFVQAQNALARARAAQ
jgi:Flp pilus assembly protein TadD